jgi:hypothetical protein
VPAGDGFGNTRIGWQRQAAITAQLYVAENCGEEKLMVHGSKEAVNAPWIQPRLTVFAL